VKPGVDSGVEDFYVVRIWCRFEEVDVMDVGASYLGFVNNFQ